LYKKLERYPHPSMFKRFFDYLMYTVATLSPIAILIQVIEVYSTHNVAGLSLLTWVLLGGVNLLWTIYGILHKEAPIVISSAAFCVLNFALVAGILLYR
jgi:uncharacterized protein with PQ loop repeat